MRAAPHFSLSSLGHLENIHDHTKKKTNLWKEVFRNQCMTSSLKKVGEAERILVGYRGTVVKVLWALPISCLRKGVLLQNHLENLVYMYPSRLVPGQAVDSSWEIQWLLARWLSKERSIWKGLSCPECLPYISHTIICLGDGLRPYPEKFLKGWKDTLLELTTKFLESEGDEFNSPVTSRDLKK